MTFYNVISGILFFGAVQVLLASLGTPSAWPAAALTIIILNESVMTSELLEAGSSSVSYTLPMKLVDLLGFSTLVWALLILSPTSNTFNVNVSDTLPGANTPRWFWGLLTVYWLVTLVWNHLAQQVNKSKWQCWFLWAMHLMWAPTLVAFVVTYRSDCFEHAARWPGMVVFVTVAVYLGSKLVARK